MNTTRQTPTARHGTITADSILVIMDGSTRAHTLVHDMLRTGRRVVLTAATSHDLVPFIDASVRAQVWAVVSDPSDPEQIDSIIERADDLVGPVVMIVDPGGLLADVAAADRQVA
ncbi:hypothetical protein NWF22_24150 [Gordonia mangrovi]|nr:hypothetical protein NWF22_24150 [Gordonia mangrovi]